MQRLPTWLMCIGLGILGLTGLPARADTVKGVSAFSSQALALTGVLTATVNDKNDATLDIVLLQPESSEAINRYDSDMTKDMHVIIVGDDFETFQHQHVDKIGADGHARLSVHFPQAGLYHIYVDATPAWYGQQVVRFDLAVNTTDSVRHPAAVYLSTGTARAGQYAVTFGNLDNLTAGNESMLPLHILKNEQPANDITSYLGVPAHVVMIDTATLAYVHAHPMEAGIATVNPVAGTIEPDLMLHIEPPQPGIYRVWIQFMGDGRLRTIPYTIKVN